MSLIKNWRSFFFESYRTVNRSESLERPRNWHLHHRPDLLNSMSATTGAGPQGQQGARGQQEESTGSVVWSMIQRVLLVYAALQLGQS